CHGEGRGFESRLGRSTPSVLRHRPRPGSSVGTSDRLKSGRSAVRPRPWPHLADAYQPQTTPATGYTCGNRSPVRAKAQLASCAKASAMARRSLGKGFWGMRQPLGRSDAGSRFPFWSLPVRVKIAVLVVEAVVVG